MKFLDQSTGFLSGYTGTIGYILKTTNSGETLSVIANNLSYCLSDICGGTNTTLWAIAGGKDSSFIAKSTDHGATWNSNLSTGTKQWQSMCFVSEDQGYVLRIILILSTLLQLLNSLYSQKVM
jgi:hypothetical protein